MASALYDSFIAGYYDESPLVQKRLQDVVFYRDAARDCGDPVLELGCGTGRVTMAVAEAGKRITGLELSERMLERAVKKRGELRVEARERVHLVQGDMAKFDLGEKFRLVIIPFRVFQHLLEERQQIGCLECVQKHLMRKGRLILDVFQTDAERMAAFHRAEQRNDVEMIFSVVHPGGRKERLVFAWTLRYFFRYEVEHLLARCGFKVSALYGDFDRTPVRDESPEMIFVAERQE